MKGQRMTVAETAVIAVAAAVGLAVVVAAVAEVWLHWKEESED